MSKTIYRSKVLGDETTEPIPAVLTAADADMVEELKRLLTLLKLGEDAIATIRVIQANCPHHYFRDTAGFPYDTRTCAVCGAHMGQL